MPSRSENSTASSLATPSILRSSVKWSDPAKNFCYLKLADGREAFLHRDDFDGEWPPRRMHTVLFSVLIESNHWRCKWRAKDAVLPGAL